MAKADPDLDPVPGAQGMVLIEAASRIHCLLRLFEVGFAHQFRAGAGRFCIALCSWQLE